MKCISEEKPPRSVGTAARNVRFLERLIISPDLIDASPFTKNPALASCSPALAYPVQKSQASARDYVEDLPLDIVTSNERLGRVRREP